jgi:hypothetical protein
LITPEEVVALFNSRKRTLAVRHGRMEELRKAYAGDISVPLPELDRNEKPMVANLIQAGLDGAAMRVSSTLPMVSCPPTRPGFENSERAADLRRNAIYGFWESNRLGLIQRKRSRWLMGYSSAPVMIRPDPVRSIPKWQERNPLTAFGPPGDDLDPVNFLFSFKKSLAWLRRIYPESMAGLDLGKPANEVSPDTEFTVVEYADHEVICQVVIGASPDEPPSSSGYAQPMGVPRPGRPWAEIEWQPNLAGICPVVNPTTIGLDEPAGYYDGLIGLYWWQSKLMALGGLAAERDVFPDEWLVERPNEVGAIEVEADGQQGIRGIVKGGQIATTHAPPGQQTMLMINNLERNIRVTGGIPAEMTGESASNIRTARRGAQVLSSAIDFRIQECQASFEAALEEENRRAIAIDKAYFGDMSKPFYVSWGGFKAQGVYTPNETWDTDHNRVRFPFAGADTNELVVSLGQRLGMEMISHYTAMQLDPYIEDPELERDRISGEGIDRAFMQGLQAQIADGTIPPDDAAYIVKQIVVERIPTFQAVINAQERAQARQASAPSAGPADTPAALPPGSPETQPGLAQPGMGAEAASIQGPAPAAENLQALMQNLRRTSPAA